MEETKQEVQEVEKKGKPTIEQDKETEKAQTKEEKPEEKETKNREKKVTKMAIIDEEDFKELMEDIAVYKGNRQEDN